MRIGVFVQARMNSTRLPNKVFKKIGKFTILEIIFKRILKTKYINKDSIFLLTSNNKSDLPLVKKIKNNGFQFYKGSEDDVLDRFYKAAKKFKVKNIIRITGDCPLIDYNVLTKLIELHFQNKADLTTNVSTKTYPDGLDAEIFTFDSLEKAWKKKKNKTEREHVTIAIKNDKKNKISKLSSSIDYSKLRLTIDEKADYDLIKELFKKFKNNIYIDLKQIGKFYKKNKSFFNVNKHILRDEGMYINKSAKLWKRAKEIIPGGNMFFSKRPEIFSNKVWPTYFEKAKGCKIWSLEGKIYNDFSYMGVGTNVLGYANSKIDKFVSKIILNGNMSTLNAPQDIYLAEKILELNPWAEMVKFARSGGEANAVAIRIARAATKRKKVAVCGYHGWHDWYLASYLKDSKDNKFFKNDLPVGGVLKNLQNSIYTFEYNNFDDFKKLIDKNSDIGIVKMEIERNISPKNNFLQKIRRYTQKKNIILIFDECTSGFRESKSGLHLEYNVIPDMVIYGKALGNGYPITAVLGLKSIMEAANKTFISSTFWSERIGTTAAVATINEMSRINSWKIIKEVGRNIKDNLKKISKNSKLNFSVFGLDSMPSYKMNDDNHLAFKTYITEEMLKKGFLATDSIYVSISHDNKKLLERYFYELDNVCKNFKKKLDNGDMNYKKNELSKSTFSRLN
jgi:glutamate-1-semialdehyde 2,1-aminomutase|tara:strand:+ start:5294 stop:7327 length:2034 start_codon:yes stop_codon:yes gene_type:complete